MRTIFYMIDFTELSDNGQDLELLVRELLFSMGYGKQVKG